MFLLKQEIGKAKTERKKEQAKASMKSFSTMVKYCEEAKCRHRVFRYLYNTAWALRRKRRKVFIYVLSLKNHNSLNSMKIPVLKAITSKKRQFRY